jgi:hypothetical protein
MVDEDYESDTGDGPITYTDDALCNNAVLMDSCSNLSVFRNCNLVEQRKEAFHQVRVRTTYGTVTKLYMEEGIINVRGVKHAVFLDPYASSNIISKSKFAKICKKIGFSLSNPSQYGKSNALDCVLRDRAQNVVMTIGYVNDLAQFQMVNIYDCHLTAYGAALSKDQLKFATEAR